MKIYTKTGDDGTTSLFDGTRVSKGHARIQAYGDVDELNSLLGLALAGTGPQELKFQLLQIQKDLFALGAQLANPTHKKQKAKSDFNEEKIGGLEKSIDAFESDLEPMKNFILPGGDLMSSWLHLARTVCRRAERHLVLVQKAEALEPLFVKYLNRLSDYLFVAARWANWKAGVKDIPWM